MCVYSVTETDDFNVFGRNTIDKETLVP